MSSGDSLIRRMCCFFFESLGSIQRLLHRLSIVVSLLWGLVLAYFSLLAGPDVRNPPTSRLSAACLDNPVFLRSCSGKAMTLQAGMLAVVDGDPSRIITAFGAFKVAAASRVGME